MSKTININDYPQLSVICWSRDKSILISGEDALALYERNWRYVDKNDLTITEKEFISQLVEKYGNGVLNV